MDHSELVAEIPLVEKMSTQDRLKHAKKRRTQQLKRYSQYEKQLDKENNKKKKSVAIMGKKPKKKGSARVNFVNNVVLLESAARNDIEEVRKLLMNGVTPDVTNEDGLTALHQCCIDDCEDMMKLLIEFNANVNARDSELWTPLHAAATCGHVHLCKYLIEKSAELLAVNADGNMPYDICEDEVTLDYIESEMAKRGVTQELIDDTRLSTERQMLSDLEYVAQSSEDLEMRDRNGATPIHIAAANGYLQVAEFLLDHHVSVDVEDNDSWQPIHAAACWGHLVMLELLVQNGADIEARTRTGETPFDICEDPEMKQRIMEMKDELETNKARRSADLYHRRNQNTRSSNSAASLYSSNTSLSDKNPFSASVRRTSMRDKSKLSWKEALDEAKHLRGGPAPIDQNGDEDTEAEITQKVSSLEEDEKELSTSQSASATATSDSKRSHEHLPSTNIDDVKVAVSDTQARKQSKEYDSHTALQDHGSQNKIHKQKHPPPPTTSTTTTTNPEQRPPPSATVPDHTGSSASINKADSDNPADHRKNSNVSHSEMRPIVIHPAHGQLSGTLADLKKQRAQQFQNSLRYRDTKNLQQKMDDVNGKEGQVGTNGQANSVGNNHTNANNNLYYSQIPTDPPIHRFTANSTTEIIGGDDGKQRCCCVM